MLEYADLLSHRLYEVRLRPAQFQRRGFHLISVPVLYLHHSAEGPLAESLLNRILIFRRGLASYKLVFVSNKVALLVRRDLLLLGLG